MAPYIDTIGLEAGSTGTAIAALPLEQSDPSTSIVVLEMPLGDDPSAAPGRFLRRRVENIGNANRRRDLCRSSGGCRTSCDSVEARHTRPGVPFQPPVIFIERQNCKLVVSCLSEKDMIRSDQDWPRGGNRK